MSEIQFHFINVGKGSCTIIDFPTGHLSVIDIDDSRALSEDEKTAMETLQKAKPNNPIDYIVSNFSKEEIFRFILSHPDMDHMSGIKTLFKKKYVRNFWHVSENKPDPGSWENSPYDKTDWEFYQSLKNEKVSGVTVVNPLRNGKADCCWIQDGITILSPTTALVEKAEESEEYDHLSYVLQIAYNGIRILLTGDSTKEALEDIVATYKAGSLQSSILLAPGHGSKNHVSKDFLEAVQPRLTVVSVAEGVDYDSDAYKNYGRVLSTKYYGDVRVRIKGNKEVLFRTEFQNYSDNWYILKQRNDYYKSR